MKVILVGYPGSQKIVPVSKYLIGKYFPQDILMWAFDIRYINHTGNTENWASFLSGFLSAIDDRYIIFALDDYLISDYLNIDIFLKAFLEINDSVPCIKLCNSTKEEHLAYPVTTQYTIWNREYLIGLLSQVKTPWEFELKGSKLFDKVCLHRPCIDYFTNSALSSRWEGIRLDGLKEEDIKYIKDHGWI